LLHENRNELRENRTGNEMRVELGKSFRVGKLEILPERIRFMNLPGVTLSDSKSYVLTIKLRNISDGLVLPAFSEGAAVDNFGNKCLDSGHVSIRRNKIYEDIQPGESAVVYLAFEPATEKAKYFDWTITTETSKQGESQNWRIRFSPDDAKTINSL
jgi:hypothetical protein